MRPLAARHDTPFGQVAPRPARANEISPGRWTAPAGVELVAGSTALRTDRARP